MSDANGPWTIKYSIVGLGYSIDIYPQDKWSRPYFYVINILFWYCSTYFKNLGPVQPTYPFPSQAIHATSQNRSRKQTLSHLVFTEREVNTAVMEAWSECNPKPSLQIDLYNFEDPRYECSKYVLTSPRSLEACSKLGLKVGIYRETLYNSYKVQPKSVNEPKHSPSVHVALYLASCIWERWE